MGIQLITAMKKLKLEGFLKIHKTPISSKSNDPTKISKISLVKI